jgi:ceramide glucosyltransferase
MILYWAAMAALVLAVAGCMHLVAALVLVARFARNGASAPQVAPTVTILKPLHGAEDGLYDNLASFCRQDYPAPVEIVCGVADAGDAAVAVVERLRTDLPAHAIALVIDPTLHGSNRKVSNLINMAPRIHHEVVVLADSDIRVAPDYLARGVAALHAPGVGAVTCLYHGVALGGAWSRLLALGIDSQFLPNAVVGVGLGLAQPCFGSTIAMRRETLAAVGGFQRVADTLADDYALGAAVRAAGLRIAIPAFAVAHVSGPMRAGEVWRQELRWARTIRAIEPVGYAGSLVTYPLAWALLAAILGGFSVVGSLALIVAVAAIAGRMALLACSGRRLGFRPHSYWLVPARDLFSFAIFATSFFGRAVVWRGQGLRVGAAGRLLSGGGSQSS